ncbi:MAG: hypothetical protein HY873_06330 [Chloroflexi bacterium]|nr:hypothetical protein [Chloroflexota bacterium]
MNRIRLAVLGLLLLPALLTACDSLGAGPKKLIITEGGCQNLKFLRMKLGQETRIVLDNEKHHETQDGMSLVMDRFPMTVTGDPPPQITYGPDFTSVTLSTNPGEKTSVDVKAFATGEYKANCNIAITQSDSNQVIQTKIAFQITDD